MEEVDMQYGMTAFNPQWEFGTGLSYSTLHLSSNVLNDNDSINISVDVINNTAVDGKETALLFIADRYASITPSVRRLRGFDKKLIKAGEKVTYAFTILKTDLAFVDLNNQWITEEGWFDISIGGLTAEFEYKNK